MKSGSTLLAFDFDGTLAPIREDPGAVRLGHGARTLLRETSRIRGVAVAIVSGRDIDDLAARAETPGVYLIGSHGLDMRGPGDVVIRDARPLSIELPADLHREIDDGGLRLEIKKHARALHWRGVDLERATPVVERFRSWIRESDLQTIDGRCVIEGRLPGEGKEEAVRWLAGAIGASRVMYAGDDATDFGALRFAAESGRGIFVQNDERIAPPGVTVVGSFLELFRLVRAEVMI